jgi:hypothetical protein
VEEMSTFVYVLGAILSTKVDLILARHRDLIIKHFPAVVRGLTSNVARYIRLSALYPAVRSPISQLTSGRSIEYPSLTHFQRAAP